LLFISLLCKLEPPEAVEKWVKKSYCPIEACLKKCRQADNGYGEAVLLLRSGKPHDAIKRYCDIIEKDNILRLLE